MTRSRRGYTGRIERNVLPERYVGPRLVARGGMGEVYRATDSVLERPVAVKLLSELYAADPESRARFRREARAAARLARDRHVVTVFDVGEHEGRPLIVMEFVDGKTVHERLREGRVPREQALRWLEQAAQALDHAHANGVVHRDVKPGNLLLDSEDEIRVSDFGVASAVGLESVTLPGTVLGTAGYLSPEQARGEAATPSSDRYSLGVIAFELLTGRRPFDGDTPATEAFAHLNAPIPSATTHDPSLPAEVDRVLARALAKDPEERPASCAELVADLRAAFDGTEVADAPASSPAPEAEGATRVLEPPSRTRVLPGVAPRGPGRRSRARPGARLASATGAALGSSTEAARRVGSAARRNPRTSAVALASSILLAGLALSLLVGAGGDSPRGDENRSAASATDPSRETTEPEQETISDPGVDGAALNASGYELMQAGRYEEALPILREAVLALRWTGVIDEAYASYNLAFTRFALGRCDGVIGLLDRSEAIQGDRTEIDALRDEWTARCGSGDADEADGADEAGAADKVEPPGNSKGKGKGKGKGRGDD